MLSVIALAGLAWSQSPTLSAGAEWDLTRPSCCAARVGGTFAPSEELPLVIGGSFSYNPRPLAPNYVDTAVIQITSWREYYDDFQWPIERRVFTVEAVAGLELLPVQRRSFAGGPVLYWGLGLARIERAALVYAEDLLPPVTLTASSAHFAVPFSAGAGVQGWFGEHVGARVTWSRDAHLGSKPQLDPDVTAEGRILVVRKTMNVDLLVAL